jgi:ribonucleoside-diphosphate reductase alpha chain
MDGKAPGPDPLRKALENIRTVIESRIKAVRESSIIDETDVDLPPTKRDRKQSEEFTEQKESLEPTNRKHKLSDEPIQQKKRHVDVSIRLRPIDAFDIITHSSDAVIAGGVRRSALITLFSLHDSEMMAAKTGDWYIKNPQRGRSNNSVMLLRDQVSKEEFLKIIDHTKQFGEPGFIWTDDLETLYNPCGEIKLYGHDKVGNSGCEFCNLTEINMKEVKAKNDFYDACEVAAALGTFQAAYTAFPYLGDVTESIVRDESLIGVSMTGMMDCPKIAFDPKVQRHGAKLVVGTNKVVAKLLGINTAARCTTVKPAGSTSCILGSASGIHPHHAKRYFRRVQANKSEKPLQYYKRLNPASVEESKWSANVTDDAITFLCEAPEGALTRDSISNMDMLNYVLLTQQNWIQYGSTRNGRHNVSNTITVKADEWDLVARFIHDNRYDFAGISLLSASGDRDYVQAPFQSVYKADELIKMYGNGAMLASGLIVHATNAFDGNLYRACDTFLGIGEQLEPISAIDVDHIPESIDKVKKIFDKITWVQRASKFAKRYFGGDKHKTMICLKDIDAFKTWCDIERSLVAVDWEQLEEYEDNTNPSADAACAGGVCSLVRI